MGLQRFRRKRYDRDDVLDDYYARSTGCDCCASELSEPKEIRAEAMQSLNQIINAAVFFRWNVADMIKEARANARAEKDAEDQEHTNAATRRNEG